MIQISELLSFNEKRMSHIVINCQIDISVVIFLIVEKRSVLEPSLSAMYQLQITDDEVCRDTGYIFVSNFY